MDETPLPGSFRDPAGRIVVIAGRIHRRIAPRGVEQYRHLMRSGLYEKLVARRLLIPHDEVNAARPDTEGVLLRPTQIPMISYPYEWSLAQLRDAALLTLDAQREALALGMTLADASAFNVQFYRGEPILIDTLSFEPYRGGPWKAYRQFCQHFYAPLLLGAAADSRLVRAAGVFIDGVPLPLASRLLPRASWLRPGPLFHIHLHARAEARWSTRTPQSSAPASAPAASGHAAPLPTSSSRSAMALVDSLRRAIEGVRWRSHSAWATYYADAESYTPDAFASKVDTVARWLDVLRPASVWDLGANTGHFSKLAAERGAHVVAFDSDAASVEALYLDVQRTRVESVLPLLLDLSAPSAAVGWANEERMSLAQRGPADLMLALALIHHLAVGHNVPLPSIAEYFARLAKRLIVEFVPKSDPMVQRMLRARTDIFDAYDERAFEHAFSRVFRLEERVPLPSGRALYLMASA